MTEALPLDVWRAITTLGSGFALGAVVVLASLAFATRRDLRSISFLVIVWASGVAISSTIKAIVDKPRPDDPLVFARGAAFPSGHAMGATVVYGALAWLLSRGSSRRHRVILFASAGLLIAAIALSRIALRVHDLADVTAGIGLGIVWLIIAGRIAAARPDRSADPSG